MFDRPLVILDFETTGLTGADRVIEIAALRIDAEGEREFHSLCNPGCPVSPFVQELTGITDADLAGAPPATEAIVALWRELLLDQPVLVAHNVQFDRRFLDQELALASLPPFGGDVICTMSLAFQLLPAAPSKKLPELIRYLRIESSRSHRALDDVLATRQVLAILLEGARRLDVDPINNLSRRPLRAARG